MVLCCLLGNDDNVEPLSFYYLGHGAEWPGSIFFIFIFLNFPQRLILCLNPGSDPCHPAASEFQKQCCLHHFELGEYFVLWGLPYKSILVFIFFQGEPVLFSWSRQVTKQHHSAGKPKGALDIPDFLHMLAHFSFGWKCSWAVLCTSSNCLGALLTVWIAAGINGVCRAIAGMCMGWLWWATFRSFHTSPHLDTALHITQSHCIHCCTGGRGDSRCRQLGRRLQVWVFFCWSSTDAY